MNVFSQNVTEVSKDTTKIVLSTSIARKVAIDLAEGDEAKQLVQEQREEINTLRSLVLIQDTLVAQKNKQIESLTKVIELYKVEVQQETGNFEQLNKNLKRQTAMSTVFGTTTAISALALVAVLVFGGGN